MSENPGCPPEPQDSAYLARGVVWNECDWQLIAESIPHIVWVARPDRGSEYFNRQGTDYTGMEPGSNYDWGWTQVVHPDDVELARDGWADAVASGTTYSLEYRIRRFDGEFRWHAFRAQAVRDARGNVVKWVGTATDIDDQKRHADRLFEAQRTSAEALTILDTLQAEAPVGFGFVDRHFRFVRINQELAAMHGTAVEEHLGRSVAEVVPGVWNELEGVYRHVLDAGEAVRNLPVGDANRNDQGRRHDWLGSFYPVKIGDRIVGVGVVVVDITHRVQSEGFWSAVMSQVADGVYAQDDEGRLTYMNRAASAMLGWSEDELRGKHVHEVVHFQKLDGTPLGAAECAVLTEAPSGRLLRSGGEAFTRKDGSTFPVAYSAMPLGVGSGVQGVAVVFRDATEPGSSPNLIRVLIADAKTTSEGFQALLNRQEGVEVVGMASTSAAAVSAARRLRPDVALIDYELPDLDGAETAAIIRAGSPATNVILMTDTYNASIVVSGIAAGCAGVLDKGQAWVELVGAVRAAHHGEATIAQAEFQRVLSKLQGGKRPSQAADLTQREREVLACIKEGCSNPVAAERLGLSANTVRNHVQRILYKLNVHSKLEAVVVASRDGLLDEI